MNQIDSIRLLEYKLDQDLLALKKVLKWEKTIQTRIERTKLQLQTLKQSKSIFLSEQTKFSKIPMPVQIARKIVSKQKEQIHKILIQLE